MPERVIRRLLFRPSQAILELPEADDCSIERAIQFANIAGFLERQTGTFSLFITKIRTRASGFGIAVTSVIGCHKRPGSKTFAPLRSPRGPGPKNFFFAIQLELGPAF